MARTAQRVAVGKRSIELSNLSKVLYPEDGLIKAEVVQYYLQIAPTLLNHVKGRPLSLVRFPDGIHGETFFQKNRPEWAPAWLEGVTLGDERKSIDYIIATEEASLVWLANLACLEVHQMHCRTPSYDLPDYFVFDLDPPEGTPFNNVVEIALALRDHVEGFGYQPFAKTTGRKGIHILVPINAKHDFHRVFEAAKEIAQPFVKEYASITTLHIRKEARKGRILIDIYRNRGAQTIVAPYSLRGSPGGPVSMPLSWDDLTKVEDPREFDIHSVVEKVVMEGDAWEGMRAYSVDIHTDRKPPSKALRLAPSRKRKTPEALEAYQKKRVFDKTPEPPPLELGADENAFVVHRHHATRLHYDLRLEVEGTLKSWAVPRGMPPRPGIKRLAVATEDHPIEYLHFEAEIPKGQYGGGMMWIYARGKYEITKHKKDGFYFRLDSEELTGDYRIYQTGEKEWLLERLDTPQVDWLHDWIEPMLSEKQDQTPRKEEDYLFELKWDGIRALVSLDEGEITILSRNKRDITSQFPELDIPDQAFRATAGRFDGEIVCFDADGKPDFKAVVRRLQHTSEGTVKRAAIKHPAYCYLFDCMYLDGRALVREPIERRREWLSDAVRRDTAYRVSEAVDEGGALFDAVRSMGLEGIMAKERGSLYLPGRRTRKWIKVKVRQTEECLVIGYTRGRGDRAPYFGALHIAQRGDQGLIYRGKVGSGFTMRMLKAIFSDLIGIAQIERPIREKPLDDPETVWIEPELICEVQYASITDNGTYREPIFVRMRPDLMDSGSQ